MPDTLKILAEGFSIHLTDKNLADFDAYTRLLLCWNEKINLTAITDPDEIVCKHYLDSLILLDAASFPDGARVIDIGSGAGFPGIPLKIARPNIDLTLLDSQKKRLNFLEELSRHLKQENSTLHGRAEDLAHNPKVRESFDIAAARAVANLPYLCELVLAYLKVGGVFLAMKGPDAESEAKDAAAAAAKMGAEIADIREYDIPGAGHRKIITIEKISHTSANYPRNHKKMIKAPLK